jgi:predicted TPR repeat methyltransferase
MQGGIPGARLSGMTDDIAAVLLAIAEGDEAGAAARAGAVASAAVPRSPEQRLADGLRRHLAAGQGGVYDEPAAFEQFIDGGGNVELYRRAHAVLAERHARLRPHAVLDIGCGDGRLTQAALRPGLDRIDLVEPSAELLATAEARLTGDAVVVPRPGTAQQLLGGAERWDVTQSTFALHAVPPDERAPVLAGLAGRTSHLLLIEFDLPDLADRSADHARYAAERYVEGVAEYADAKGHDDADGDLVVDGFLVPVLAGQFAPDRPRHTWEQPIDAWAADLGAAGFTEVRHALLHDYWWAPAHLLEAEGIDAATAVAR